MGGAADARLLTIAALALGAGGLGGCAPYPPYAPAYDAGAPWSADPPPYYATPSYYSPAFVPYHHAAPYSRAYHPPPQPVPPTPPPRPHRHHTGEHHDRPPGHPPAPHPPHAHPHPPSVPVTANRPPPPPPRAAHGDSCRDRHSCPRR